MPVVRCAAKLAASVSRHAERNRSVSRLVDFPIQRYHSSISTAAAPSVIESPLPLILHLIHRGQCLVFLHEPALRGSSYDSMCSSCSRSRHPPTRQPTIHQTCFLSPWDPDETSNTLPGDLRNQFRYEPAGLVHLPVDPSIVPRPRHLEISLGCSRSWFSRSSRCPSSISSANA